MNAYVLTLATAPAVTGVPNHRRVFKLPRVSNCSDWKKSEAGKIFRQSAMAECINAYVTAGYFVMNCRFCFFYFI
jgi:hypothetical protein